MGRHELKWSSWEMDERKMSGNVGRGDPNWLEQNKLRKRPVWWSYDTKHKKKVPAAKQKMLRANGGRAKCRWADWRVWALFRTTLSVNQE